MIPPVCANCPKRDTCTELCPKAKKYLPKPVYLEPSLDIENVSQNEVIENLSSPTTTEQILCQFFLNNYSQAQVARNIGVSRQWVHEVVIKYKPRIAKILRKSLDMS